jgi:hypothetical protein
VVSANATSDGKPLLWKVRDNSELPNNEVVFDTTCMYKFIAVVNNGDTSVWMGVNEKGLAIVNSTAKDLPATSTGYSNGTLMRTALGYCCSVNEFEELLIETNDIGRRTRANFGLIDSTGTAVIFEVSGKNYWKYDANNSRQAPNGYLIRTNFSITGGGNLGIERFRRTESLIKELYQRNELNYEGIIKNHLRDFSDRQSNQLPIPYMNRWGNNKPFGYLYSNYSVCRYISISASVFNGVKSSELANLTTMWTMLGQSAGTIILPYWPVGETPVLARGTIIAPLKQVANDIKSYLFDDINNRLFVDTYKLRDELGYGLWDMLLNLEDSIIASVESEIYNGDPDQISYNGLISIENNLARLVYSKLEKAKNELSALIKIIVENKKPYSSFGGINFKDGYVIHLIDAGNNGKSDPPIENPFSPNFGMPGGDDIIVGNYHYLGENVDLPNMIYFPVLLWKNVSDLPYIGNKIYMRIFDSDNLPGAEWYGDAQIYEIQKDNIQEYEPEILTINSLSSEDSDQLIYTSQQELSYHLYSNYPNPFNPTTKIRFTIADPTNLSQGETFVSLKVYDLRGREVITLVNEEKPAGNYEIDFDGSKYPSGVYFYILQAGDFVQTNKMLMIK